MLLALQSTLAHVTLTLQVSFAPSLFALALNAMLLWSWGTEKYGEVHELHRPVQPNKDKLQS